MTALEYIRTDRNGTKIYHDWNCPRCGGAGRSDNWWATGFTCYECGGSGRRNNPKIVKEYTPEYAAKLEARRIAKLPPPPSAEELLARAEEARHNAWQSEGFSSDGIGFIYAGNTYPNKETIRRAGGKWCAYMSAWVAPRRVDGLQGVRITEVNARDLCNEYGRIDPEKCWDMQDKI